MTGTPTFFIAGLLYDGEYETEPLLEALREALQAATERQMVNGP